MCVTRTGGLGNKRKNGDYPNNDIVVICQNTKNNSRDLKRLAVTKTSVANDQLNLV